MLFWQRMREGILQTYFNLIIIFLIVPINNELERKIADAFEVFDHAGTKTIDIREVGTIVRALGCCPSEAEIQEILVAIEDPATPGSVHLSRFLPHVAQIITEHKYVNHKNNTIQAHFIH